MQNSHFFIHFMIPRGGGGGGALYYLIDYYAFYQKTH